MASFLKIAEVGPVMGLACTPDGSLVAVNDAAGRVRIFAVEAGGEPARELPLELSADDSGAVLLHPDGRVLSVYQDQDLLVRIHDPRSGELLRRINAGPAAPDQRPLRRTLDILQRRPKHDWLMPLELANVGRGAELPWLRELPNELLRRDIEPTQFTSMALRAPGRELAVMTGDTRVIDLESGAVIRQIAWGVGSHLHRYNEGDWGLGIYAVGFDEQGLLRFGGTGRAPVREDVSPEFLRNDADGVYHSIATLDYQLWYSAEIATGAALHDPVSRFPAERIPAGMVLAAFRRRAIELWSNAGLIQTIPLDPKVCVIPAFDPSGCCRQPQALLLAAEGLALLDLESGQQHPRHPPLAPGALEHSTWIGFDESRQRLLAWPDARTLLVGSTHADEWSVCHMPEHRRMRDWAFAGEGGRAFVLDEGGDLWLGECGRECGPGRGSSSAGTFDPLAELRRAVAQQPQAIEPTLVYADALIARGDPRGELIMLQHHGALAEADALLERHNLALTGGLAQLCAAVVELEWKRGFVRSARIALEQVEHTREQVEQLEIVLVFLGNESACLLESLSLSCTPAVEDAASYGSREIANYLAAARHLPWLRELKIDGERYGC